jgi:adenylate cyclase
MDPKSLLELISNFYELIHQLTFQNNGIVSQFLGDGAMVIFPSNSTKKETETMQIVDSAIKFVKELQVETKKMNLDVRSGTHVGDVLLGTFGKQRLVYTAIGDVVNTAARIEAATREFFVQNLVSHQVQQFVN